jgi:cysteinyl-tRNA synthetase
MSDVRIIVNSRAADKHIYFFAFFGFEKYLRHQGYDVFYLQNITDVDDKIIARAREKGVNPKDLARAFEKEYLSDMKSLNINSVSKYARATDHIKEIITQVQRLQKKNIAYEIEDDGIYFDIAKFKNYGKLAGRTSLSNEDSISRIDYSIKKRNRGDFCLWKFAIDSSIDKTEPIWPSPFGRGRPGWHIEDTAITEKFFGPQYDIHGGAIDLIFPHHEGEVAIMESISDKSPLVNYWVHAGFLTVAGQKMSKSLGNFTTVKDFLKRYKTNYIRFLMIKNLWRSPVDYSESAMIEVKSAVERIEDFLRNLKNADKPKSKKDAGVKKFKDEFYKQLSNDFNTPKAFATMFDFIKKTNSLLIKNSLGVKDAKDIYNFFQEVNKVFGIIDFKRVNISIPPGVRKLVQEREKYRVNKDWQKADKVRQEIEKKGFTVEDTIDGPVIKVIK